MAEATAPTGPGEAGWSKGLQWDRGSMLPVEWVKWITLEDGAGVGEEPGML